MKSPKLIPIYTDSFVGLRFQNNELEFCYPFELESEIRNPKINHQFAFQFLRTIRLNSHTSKNKNQEHGRFFNSMYWVIQDFINNGIERKKNLDYKTNNLGKVSWKKTFKKPSFIYSKKSLILSNLIVEKHTSIEDEIYKVHQYCLNYSIERIGWLFNLQYRQYNEINLLNAKSLLLTLLQKSFQDKQRIKFTNLLNIITRIGALKDLRSYTIIGSDDYNLIFQNMLHKLLHTRKLRLRNYNPTGIYHFLNGHQEKQSQTYPDIIYENLQSSLSIVFDAKFYRSEISLPQTNDIQKQITYARYIKSQYKINLNKDINVFSSFILPYNGQSFFELFGQAYIEGINQDNIACFHVNLSALIKSYLNGTNFNVSILENQIVNLTSP